MVEAVVSGGGRCEGDPARGATNIAEVRSGPTNQSVGMWVTNTEFGWVNTGFHLLVTC